MRRRAEKYSPFAGVDTIEGVAFVVGAEAANVKNVGLTFLDADGKAIKVRGSCYAYLADDAVGAVPNAVAVSGTIVVGTNGTAVVLVAKQQWRLVSNAVGLIDLNITEAGVKTVYLVVCLPDGAQVVSPAITFA